MVLGLVLGPLFARMALESKEQIVPALQHHILGFIFYLSRRCVGALPWPGE